MSTIRQMVLSRSYLVSFFLLLSFLSPLGQKASEFLLHHSSTPKHSVVNSYSYDFTTVDDWDNFESLLQDVIEEFEWEDEHLFSYPSLFSFIFKTCARELFSKQRLSSTYLYQTTSPLYTLYCSWKHHLNNE